MKKNKKIIKWIEQRKKKLFLSVKIKNLSDLKKWSAKENKIFHVSKKFFKILGVEISSNFHEKRIWDQPLIYQNEKGILGILSRKNKKGFEYLLQAKMEPGNINKLQLSPTVQATKSNYSRVHKGKKVRYLNFFKNIKKKQTIVNSLQSEQGGRYLFKYNNNIIINTNKKINSNPNYIWVNKFDLNEIINKNNLLNMDSISVFSCAVRKNLYDFPNHSIKKIYYWFNKLSKKYYIKRKVISLSKLNNWNYNNKNIFHKSKKVYSIIGLKIKTSAREVSEWEQPIIKEMSLGLSGFIVKKINFTYHYLVRFSLKPGLKKAGLTCTVQTSDFKSCLKKNNYTNLKDNLLMKNHLKTYFINNKKGRILYNKIQSDEGGRFFHSQRKNIIVEIDESEKIRLNPNYIWMSHNQIVHFIQKGIFNIEARMLFACFNLKNIL